LVVGLTIIFFLAPFSINILFGGMVLGLFISAMMVGFMIHLGFFFIGDEKHSLSGAFYRAAHEGNLGLTELCKELGDYRVKRVMAEAARYSHATHGRLCYDIWGTSSDYALERAMSEAANGGHEAIVRLCHDIWGAADVDKAMIEAAKGGHETIMRLCHDEWGASDVNRAMVWAVRGGYESIVRLCHDEWGANWVNWTM
jgi:hypothetical protein